MYKFFASIIIYLVIISTLISFVVMDAQEDEVGYISLQGGLSSDKVEFTNIDQYIDTKLLNKGYWKVEGGNLVYSGIHPQWSDILLKGIQPDESGYYQIKYVFNNPENSRIRFIIQKAGLLDSQSYYLVYDGSSLAIPNPSYDIPIVNLFTTNIFSISSSLSGVNQSITTRFNPSTEHIEVYHNDNYLGEVYGSQGLVSASHYGGIGVFDNHLEVTSIIADITITEEPSFLDLFSMIANVIFYTIDEKYFPFIYNLLLIKLPIAVLIIGIVFWARGVP